MAKERKLAADQQFGQWTLVGQQPLGRGGNGEVWKATNDGGATFAAIKFLATNNFTDPSRATRLTRFRDEIAFMQQHAERPGFLPLLDSHCSENPTVDDRPWLVTPLATPFTRLALAGPAKLPDLVTRLERVARTLAELHAEKKYHRDLKPDNLFDLNGATVIGDFGLVDFPDKGPVTESGDAMGPRHYLAWEMLEGAADKPGGPADVYSFGKTLWVLASGHSFPLYGEQRAEIPSLRLSTYCPHPRAGILDRLLDRATRHDPPQRALMAEVADELAAWINEPKPGTLAVDFTALAKELAPVFENTAAAERRKQNFLRDAERILSRFDEVFLNIVQATAEFTKKHPEIISDTLPGRFHASEARAFVVQRWVRMVQTSHGDLYRVRLQSFVQVEALSTERVRVFAGHLVRYDIGRSSEPHWDFPWDQGAEAPWGSAELDNDVQRLRSDLWANLPKGIQAFGKQVEAAPTL